MNESKVAFVTLVTRDYYWWAKTWADSVAEHHPGAKIFVAFADDPAAGHLESLEGYEVLSVPTLAHSIGIERYPRMAFQYTPFELTCSLKPFLLSYLQQRFEKVIYLDADTLICRPLKAVIEVLDDAQIVATPHLVRPATFEKEQEIRRAGTLNGGFVAVRSGDSSRQFLNWWSQRCRFECYVDPYAGKFVDQSWLDLASHYFDGFHVFGDETYNVAYWNLESRTLKFRDDQFWVNGRPLSFFHFSGWDPDRVDQISRFDSRKIDSDLLRLAQLYNDRLVANKREELDRITCEYNSYHDEVPVDPLHREAIRGGYAQFEDIENPFDTSSNPEIRMRLDSIGEQLVLARKHWQLDELQKLADGQTQWIQKQSQRRLDRRLAGASRKFCSLVRSSWFDSKSTQLDRPELRERGKVA